MIVIPKSQYGVVKRLMSMRSNEMRSITNALANAQPSTSFSTLSNMVGADREILRLLGTLGAVREETGLSIEEFVAEFIEAAQSEEKLRPSDVDWNQLSNDLADLLRSSEPAVMTSKARELIADHDHSYCREDSRIISDIRFIFSPGEIKKPTVAAIVHMLKIAYHEESADTKAFFVALEPGDLRHLRDILDRAIAKEAALEGVLDSAGTPRLHHEQ